MKKTPIMSEVGAGCQNQQASFESVKLTLLSRQRDRQIPRQMSVHFPDFRIAI